MDEHFDPKQRTHDGLPVAGYKPQNQKAVDEVNINKRLEELVLRRLDDLKTGINTGQTPLEVDGRWLSVGRTHIEQAFMAINRAIFKPERVKLGD